MTIQDKATWMLRGLKGAGISYKRFAESIGVHVDQIYARTSSNARLSEERAAFYLRAAEKHFPAQYQLIKAEIDDMEQRFCML